MLEGPRLDGIPSNADGFIPVNDAGEVTGLDCVYAVGDATDRPIKQGGLACQQADVAAAHIAVRAGAAIAVPPLEQVLRGRLLTGTRDRFLRRELTALADDATDNEPAWWAPTKVSGKYLSPYLVAKDVIHLAAREARPGPGIDVHAALTRPWPPLRLHTKARFTYRSPRGLGEQRWRGGRRRNVVGVLTMRRVSRLTLLFAACAAASSGVAAPASAAPTRVKCPKPPKGVKDGRDVVCAFVSVPRRHGVAGPVRYRVAVSVVKAKRRGGRRPLVVLGGGPGEAIASAGPLIASRAGRSSLFGRLAQTRDVILVDQRGAGASEPTLACTREERALELTADDAANAAAGVQAYSACAARLKSAGVDLGSFTSSQIAYDVRRVVSELKLKQVDVLAISHGTKVALLAASRDERWLRRLVLASAIAPGANFITEAPKNFARALNVTLAACKRSPACARRYPDLAGRLERALASLRARPLTGAPGTPALTAGLASTLLFSLYYQPRGYAQVPSLIAKLAARDPKLLRGGGGGQDVSGLTVSLGQFFSVECAEELAGQTADGLRQGAAAYGAAPRHLVESNVQIGVGAPQICGAFGVPPSLAKPADLTRIHRPTLVVNGSYDQVTPPAYGAAVARGIRGARLVTLPAGHSPISQVGSCGYKVVARFLDARRVLGNCPR